MEYRQFSHISFDLWLTLIQSHPEFKHKRNRLLIDFFNIQVEPDIVDEAYNKYDNLFNRTNEITGGNLECYELWLVLLGDLKVDITKVSLQLLQQYIDETEKLFFEYHPTLLDKDTPKLFERMVNEGLTLSLLCNTAFTKSDFLKKLLVHLGVSKYLSFKLYSDEMGYSKPNVKVFEQMFSEVSKLKTITKKDILHIGDNPIADLGGAKNFGINGRLLLPGETVVTVFKG
jgi:putative hydrolase of the HAD superfamily